MSVVGGAAGGEGEGAAGCNDKNKNPTIECGEQQQKYRRFLLLPGWHHRFGHHRPRCGGARLRAQDARLCRGCEATQRAAAVYGVGRRGVAEDGARDEVGLKFQLVFYVFFF